MAKISGSRVTVTWINQNRYYPLTGGNHTLIVAPGNVFQEFGITTRQAEKQMADLAKALQEVNIAWDASLSAHS
jgi:hypothetical protein